MLVMDETIRFLIRHGYTVLVVVVSAEQIGLPVPTVPVLLAVGALPGRAAPGRDVPHAPASFPGLGCRGSADLGGRHHEIPRDRDVVLYCTCPNEATSAMMTLRLHRLGITRVRPLSGGFDAWVTGGFPLETKPATSGMFDPAPG